MKLYPNVHFDEYEHEDLTLAVEAAHKLLHHIESAERRADVERQLGALRSRNLTKHQLGDLRGALALAARIAHQQNEGTLRIGVIVNAVELLTEAARRLRPLIALSDYMNAEGLTTDDPFLVDLRRDLRWLASEELAS